MKKQQIKVSNCMIPPKFPITPKRVNLYLKELSYVKAKAKLILYKANLLPPNLFSSDYTGKTKST